MATMFEKMTDSAVTKIVADLKEDAFVKEATKTLPDEAVNGLTAANEEFVQGYLAGVAYQMSLTNRILDAMSKNEITQALRLKQMGNVILYLLAQKLEDPEFDFDSLKKEEPRLFVR